MKTIVLIKQVPDTETKVKVNPGDKDINREGINLVLNPYDEFAAEEAIKIKEDKGGEVIICTMGEAKADEAVRTALAMGGDRAIRIDGDEFAGSDSFATAKALAKAIEKEGDYDLILAGKQAVDDDASQVGQLVADMLGIPSVSMVIKCEVGDGSVKVSREIEGGVQELEVPTPCVLTAQKGLNEPRYPSLPGIMKAKRKKLDVLAAGDLGLGGDDVGAAGSKTEIKELSMPPERKAGQVFEGEPEEIVPKVAQLLRDEAKAI